jgi:hypothetical protein
MSLAAHNTLRVTFNLTPCEVLTEAEEKTERPAYNTSVRCETHAKAKETDEHFTNYTQRSQRAV